MGTASTATVSTAGDFLAPPSNHRDGGGGGSHHSRDGSVSPVRHAPKTAMEIILHFTHYGLQETLCFQLPTKRERTPSVISAGRPPWVDKQMAHRLKIPHTFVIHTYTKPTKCHFCGKMLMGVIKQGVKCKDCGYNAHKKCAEKVPWDCTGEVSQCD